MDEKVEEKLEIPESVIENEDSQGKGTIERADFQLDEKITKKTKTYYSKKKAKQPETKRRKATRKVVIDAKRAKRSRSQSDNFSDEYSSSAFRSSETTDDLSTDFIEENEFYNGKLLCSKLKPIEVWPSKQREKLIPKRCFNKEEYNAMLSLENDGLSKIQYQQSLQEVNRNKHGQLTTHALENINMKYSTIRFDKSRIEGWGVRTTVPRKAGEQIVEYIGEIIRPGLLGKREKHYEEKGNYGTYIFKLDEDHFLDATERGSVTRFINHSCEPNCEAKQVTLGNRKAIVLYAIKDIKPFEELTYDYKLNIETKEKAIKCLCGSKKCKGFLNYVEGGRTKEEMKRVMLPFIPSTAILKLMAHNVVPDSWFANEAEYYISKI